MAVSPEVVDWLSCCGREKDAPKFVNSGIDSINRLRKLPEDQLRKIGLESWIYGEFRKLQDRTKTGEELSQEVSNISLYAACKRGQLNQVEMFLENGGADINWHNPYDDECTPLMAASRGGHTAVVELLACREAHVNDTDKSLRWTPAHYAAEYGHLDVLEVLHQHGADLSLRDYLDETLLDVSQRHNHTAVTAYLESVGAAGTQNRNLVKKHIEQQGSLPVRALKAFLIGPSRVGKTTARRRLTEEITNISLDEIVPSTGIEAPLTVELYHPTEQSSVLLSTGWRCQQLEEQCRSLCSHVLNSPASSTVPQLDPSSSQSTVTASPVAAHHSKQPLSKLTSLFKQGLKNLIRRSRHEEAAQDELTSALSSLVKNEEWDTVREFLKDVQALTLVNFVDIGGQPEFHEVIPLLLHGLALNLIFLNVTQDLDSPYTVVYRDGKEGSSSIQYMSEFTIREIIQRALCTISSLQTTEYHNPAAILIGTHVDLTNEASVLSLDQAFQESFKDADFLKNDVLCTVNKEDEETRYIHPLDNVSEDSTDIEELRELITRIVYQRFPTEEVPTGALLLQLILRMKFDPHPGWCSVEDCVKIAEYCGISREDLLKENGILDYLHNRFGTILFYRKVVGLCLRVIVNANIIMGPPSELFVQAFGAKKGEPKTAEHIRVTGEISQQLMNNACKPENGDSHVKKKRVYKTDDRIPTDEIVALLEFRCVIYKEARSSNNDPVYFMPAVLYPDHNVAKDSSDPVLLASLDIPPILFVPSTEYAPLGQFSATAVELSKEWELDKTKRYRNRIRFYAKCEGGRLLHVEFRSLSTHLELRVLPQASPQPIDPRLMIESCRMVLKSIAKVASLYSHTRGVRWKLGFYCSHALQLGQRSHPATLDMSLDNPQEMICSLKGCCEGLIALDNKHKCWFTVMTNVITPYTQGVSGMTTPTEQVPVKQDNQSHSGDSGLTTPSTQEPVKQALLHYNQSGEQMLQATKLEILQHSKMELVDDLLAKEKEVESEHIGFKELRARELHEARKQILTLQQKLEEQKINYEGMFETRKLMSRAKDIEISNLRARMSARPKKKVRSCGIQASYVDIAPEIVRGVEVCGETVFEVVSDKLPQKLVWPGYGFNIEVPEGALPPGVTASMAIRAITKGKFKLPDNTQLIGALYWIYCSEFFLKHIEVNIQHCAIISTEEELENFKFIIAKCSQEDLPYKCIERKGVFRLDTQYATVKLKQFSIIGPVGPAGGKKYYVALKFYKQVPNSFDVRFCFIVASNCAPHIKTRCDKMKNEGWTIDDDGELQLIEFDEEGITLDLPVANPVMDIDKNWMLDLRFFPLILKDDVDRNDIQSSGCTIDLRWKGSGEIVPLSHKVTLKGAKPPRNFFTLSYHPCREKQTNNPVVADVPSDAGSPTASAGACCVLDITDLDEVKMCLNNFTGWLSLGLQLGLYYTTLESIEREESRDVEKCKTKMLAGWLQQQDKVAKKGVPCWATLEKALRNIGQIELANTVQKDQQV